MLTRRGFLGIIVAIAFLDVWRWNWKRRLGTPQGDFAMSVSSFRKRSWRCTISNSLRKRMFFASKRWEWIGILESWFTSLLILRKLRWARMEENRVLCHSWGRRRLAVHGTSRTLFDRQIWVQGGKSDLPWQIISAGLPAGTGLVTQSILMDR